MLVTVEDLFEKLKKISEKKNKENSSFDGLEFWQPIKAALSASDWKASKWKKQSETRYKKIMNMPEFYLNGYGHKSSVIEINHFLIQTVRIPKNEKPSLRKVCQIALNIGQYQGRANKSMKNNSIDSFLLKKDSSVKLKDILSPNKIKELESLLDK